MHNINKIEPVQNLIEILFILKTFDKVFSPPLSKRVEDLSEYAKKLYNFAYVYACRDKNEYYGFIAFYANDNKSRTAYLTQIAIKPNCNIKNLGYLLLQIFIKTSHKNGMKKLQLEVSNTNQKAIHFYKRNKFEFYRIATINSIYMIRLLD